jgi:hypothetical protein
MSRADEILKEKFGINTEGKTLRQVINEMNNKWNTLDEDSQDELGNLVFGARLNVTDSSMPASFIYTDWDEENAKSKIRGLRAKTKIIDGSFQISDDEMQSIVVEKICGIEERLKSQEVHLKLKDIGIEADGKSSYDLLIELSKFYDDNKEDKIMRRFVLQGMFGVRYTTYLEMILQRLISESDSEKALDKLKREFKAKGWMDLRLIK